MARKDSVAHRLATKMETRLDALERNLSQAAVSAGLAAGLLGELRDSFGLGADELLGEFGTDPDTRRYVKALMRRAGGDAGPTPDDGTDREPDRGADDAPAGDAAAPDEPRY